MTDLERRVRKEMEQEMKRRDAQFVEYLCNMPSFMDIENRTAPPVWLLFTCVLGLPTFILAVVAVAKLLS